VCHGQVLIEQQEGVTGDALEREMFILRKLIEREKAERMSAVVADEDPKEGPDAADFYICTLSNKVIVYKVCSPHCPSLGWP
jgi:glutamate synthase (ferredoxin)